MRGERATRIDQAPASGHHQPMGQKRKERPTLRLRTLKDESRVALEHATKAALAHTAGLLEVPIRVDPRMQACLRELDAGYVTTRDLILGGAKSLRHEQQIALQHIVEDGLAWEVRQLPKARTKQQYDAGVDRVGKYMELADDLLGPRKDGWKWVEHLLDRQAA